MIALILALVALAIAIVEIFRARGDNLLAWAVLALALIHVLGAL
jgi:hypothetical protein